LPEAIQHVKRWIATAAGSRLAMTPQHAGKEGRKFRSIFCCGLRLERLSTGFIRG
jgi:hypothetical protein